MMRRRRPGLGYTAVALATLAFFGVACGTPAPKGILAVERAQDGGVRLLLADCPGYVAQDVSVIADTDDDSELVDWSVHNSGRTSSVRDIQVFQGPPEGWRTTGDTLTALREGVPYVANVNGNVGGRGLRGRVPFTVEDLKGLGSGEVLTWNGGDKNVKTDRDDFLHGDPDRCKP
ncbi:hypothetical protein IMZ11_09635 [Microtetraspora sp. AC03309]|uniref:hypothetical protein n=1 Tax=Microtetraspora sp. AC03309 TaxID=2779376 RepID=UPI001E4D8763|nr:hypothetical protein [Microtetraspora sp. AC03309]MCC5575899.1 hypothetical protein [Microtetraspora sp. AC03309]